MKDKTNLTGLNPDNFRSVINGKDTGLYILRNGSGMEMCVTNYGAIVLSIMAPDSHGKFENVVIGFDTLEEARRQSKDYYIGATIGPVAGRIYNPQIQISAESETKRSIFREKDKTKRSKKESAQHSKSRNKSFVMTSVSAL